MEFLKKFQRCLKRVIFDQNQLKRFSSINKEQSLNVIETLQISGNPIDDIDCMMNLVEGLKISFPNLLHLTLKNIPFIATHGEKNSRLLLIQLMPQLISLNHSVVSLSFFYSCTERPLSD
jgi:Leucine-rich repeat (LRR) protein